MSWSKVWIAVLAVALLGACSRSTTEQAEVAPAPIVDQSQSTQPADQPASEPAAVAENQQSQAAPQAAPAEQPATQRTTRRQPAAAPAAPARQQTQQSQQYEPQAEPAPQPVNTTPARGTSGNPIVVPSPPRAANSGSAAASSYGNPPAVTQPPAPRTATLRVGTVIDIRLSEPISSATNLPGDRFHGVLDRDLEVDGQVVAKKGAEVIGKMIDVVQSGKVKGRAAMSLELTELRTGEDNYLIKTNVINIEAQDSKVDDAKKVGVGAGIGAIIGAIAGGKKGAAIGAAVGGGAGTAGVLLTRGKEVEFQPEHRFSFRLDKDVEMQLP